MSDDDPHMSNFDLYTDPHGHPSVAGDGSTAPTGHGGALPASGSATGLHGSAPTGQGAVASTQEPAPSDVGAQRQGLPPQVAMGLPRGPHGGDPTSDVGAPSDFDQFMANHDPMAPTGEGALNTIRHTTMMQTHAE